MPSAAVFDAIYSRYLAEVSAVNLVRAGERLGLGLDGDAAVLPFYGRPHRVSGRGVADAQGLRPNHAVSVILCRYLVMCPDEEPALPAEWVAYRDFKDAAPFAMGFLNTAELPIARAFGGRVEDLRRASAALGGQPGDLPVACNLIIRFPALPKVPLLMLFHDRDEDFPAHCSLLFQERARAYLDMECLAMLGMVLAIWLKDQAGLGDDG